MSDFKTRLKEERKRLGLNQDKFAQIGGVSRDTQVNYESGLRVPDSDYLAAIGAAGVDIQFLFSGLTKEDQLNVKERDLLTVARQLSDESFSAVMALAMSLAPNVHKMSLDLTDDEQAQLEIMSRESGLSVGEIIRTMVLEQANAAPKSESSNRPQVTVHGKVGQQINGDFHGTLHGPVMRKKIVKKK
ncbi:helix-turn-helix domain-containing protein [Herbaspirillum rubrisubalbicans]|uniref:helix-turn-helix domain-containing protein n=1 Tax=Herbaspirillum rubrisubalbicans TaxID=80842 RepID=UPI001559437D|nr:helix-turn-helix transcriptional regulator [Herbaspirillum rubrisubalbicans]